MSRTLASALADWFDEAELRRFLAALPEGAAVEIEALPARGGPVLAMAEAMVAALSRRGLLDDLFFDLLVSERPRKISEIRRLREGTADPPTPNRGRVTVQSAAIPRSAAFSVAFGDNAGVLLSQVLDAWDRPRGPEVTAEADFVISRDYSLEFRGTRLDPERALGTQGVSDGATLTLVTTRTPTPLRSGTPRDGGGVDFRGE